MKNNPRHHILQPFDIELESLHEMLINMTGFLTKELKQCIQALEKNDAQSLKDSIELIKGVEQIESDIDAEILAIIAKFSPVASDLRNVIATSKIASQLEKIGDEIADFIYFLISSVHVLNHSLPNELLLDSIEILRHILSLLNNIKLVFETKEINQLHKMIEDSRNYETDINNKLQEELIEESKNNADHDKIKQILRVIKLLQFCPSQIRRISGHIISLMLSDYQYQKKWISEAAYFNAEIRNFAPGSELNDWLIAENDCKRLQI